MKPINHRKYCIIEPDYCINKGHGAQFQSGFDRAFGHGAKVQLCEGQNRYKAGRETLIRQSQSLKAKGEATSCTA